MHTENTPLGYWAIPENPGPGILIIHDVWGLYDHYREMARRLAGEGFSTLAIDLYEPLGNPKVVEPSPFMRELSDPDMLARIQQGVDALHAHPSIAGPVGIIGFCMGGTYTLLAAATVNGVAAAAPFYGILSRAHGMYGDPATLDRAKKPRDALDAAKDIRCPVLASFGKEDPLIPLADVDALREIWKAHAKRPEVVVYEGAGHAFMNDSRPALYRPEAAQAAWSRVIPFFRQHLAIPRST